MAPKDDDNSFLLAVTPDDSSSPLAVAPDDSSSLLAVAASDNSDAPKLVPSSLLDSEASKIVGSTPLESMVIDFLPDSEVVPDSLPPDSEVVADSLPPGAFFAHIVSLFLKTSNLGIVHTRVSVHVPGVVSCTWTTWYSPCYTASSSLIVKF
jgi:hypothetical protein